ncbi:disease resistance protein RPM1-like [Oryza sativa Japonica Group]|jgi:disease resistance protein RPM1|uniref:disease resistance protein RPM1-like n=1 Tax=Oryza sativa subsp. japonica TaxID=39947 RepID=UPI002642A93A|nr:hypothetical protein DAI22_11g080240 [Oryza sativa Japonica Group]
MAEAVLLAVSKIGSVLGDEAINFVIEKLSAKVTELRELPENVKHIGRELRMMNKVIEDLDAKNVSINVVKGWIDELRKLAYHVEDVMDKYSYHAFQLHEEGSLTRFFRGGHHVKVFSEIASEITKIKDEIEHVQRLQQNWFPSVQMVQGNPSAIDRQGSQSCLPDLVQDDDLVGIKENRRKLIGWLDCNELDNTVITVSGMGGLGKSSLVANVYERVKKSFGVAAWIVVSQTYTIDALLRELLRKIGYTEDPLSAAMDKMDTHDLKSEIRKKLQGYNSCLVVLDDVWKKDVYDQIHDIFKNLQASRVIITTRRDDVALLAPSKRHLALQPLCKADALDLFCRRAFSNRQDKKCPPELQEVATSIVDRCKGLPLGIVSMGSLMSSKLTEHAWTQTFNQFRCELAKTDSVQAILNLSYNDLPGNLRNCFLYCSLFPEDYTMLRESLIRQWVAEGFVVSVENNMPEDVAELNLMDLITRNMLQVVDYDELGRVSTCKMHDILRELALCTAKDEKFGSANDHGTMIQMEKDVRRLSSCAWRDSDVSTLNFPLLRTLISLGAVTSTPQMLNSILTGSSYLTVLELQDSAITEVPKSIEHLFNLRYIGLRRTKIKLLPESIEKLSNLQTLDIKQTKIERLPRGIVKVKKLRHLLADKYLDDKQEEFQYFVGVQPPKQLSNLVELQTLETVHASDDLADQLDKLRKLQSVWISSVDAEHSAKLFATLSKMPLLSTLLLNASDTNQPLRLEALKPESKRLHKLIVRGRWAATMLQCPIFQDHGKNLKYLALSWCGLQEDPLLLLAPKLPNLVFLSLNRVSSVEALVISEGCFPKMRTLVLKHMPNVSQLMIGEGALPIVEGLYVVYLPKLDKVPENIESLGSLKKLCLLGLHKNFKADWDKNGTHHKMTNVIELRI